MVFLDAHVACVGVADAGVSGTSVHGTGVAGTGVEGTGVDGTSVAGTGDSSEVLCVYGAKQLAFVTVLLNSHRFENI